MTITDNDTHVMLRADNSEEFKTEVAKKNDDGGPYNVLRIYADGNAIKIFCTDEQLDQIAAAIQAEKEARA